MKNCLIDIIDVCQLKCPTCARGTRLMTNTSKSMSIDLFRKIVKKAKSEGYDEIGLYNWTEPFLSKNLPEYISIVKEFDCVCRVSSNLSLKRRFDIIEKSLFAGLDNLIVSVSGYNQEVYEINHRGGKISYVKENLEYISKLQNDGVINTKTCLKFIRFDYNICEEPLLQEYAKSLSIDFEVIDGVCHPDRPVNLYDSEESILDCMKNYVPIKIFEMDKEICSLILDTISIDCSGNAYLCCAKPNYPILRVGSYLDMTKNDILMKRYMHPVCKSCNGYKREATEKDRVAVADALISNLGEPPEGRFGDVLPRNELAKFETDYAPERDDGLLNRGTRCYKENGFIYAIKRIFNYSKLYGRKRQ